MARIQYAYSQIRKRYIWQQWFFYFVLLVQIKRSLVPQLTFQLFINTLRFERYYFSSGWILALAVRVVKKNQPYDF